jgi:hypothetical protein
MSMTYLCTVHIALFFYMTDEAMLMSYDDSSFGLKPLCYVDDWGNDHEQRIFFHLFGPVPW